MEVLDVFQEKKNILLKNKNYILRMSNNKNVNYLPMEEVIEKYFNVEKINNDIKTFTKSYRKR